VRWLDRFLLVIPLSTAVLILVTWVAPGRDGLYAILTVFTPHLAIAALIATAFQAVLRWSAVRVGLVILIVVTVARFGGEWLSLPSTAGPATFTVATWNMEWDVPGGPDAITGLAAVDADVIVLQELTPDQAATIEAAAAVTERYPYQRLEPGSVRDGIGLLSRRPLTDVEYAEDPASIRATLGGDGEPITIMTAHPHSPRIRTRGPGPIDVPVAYDVSARDRRLAEIRTRLDAAIALGPPVIAVGDFNTAPTEAAYRDLTAGLLDAHVERGQGPGWTWRPGFVGSLPMGLLRIDLILSTPDVVPVESGVVCRSVGDHCQVLAGFVPAI
jgi:endonuclease/exonuclease/phosphatase family metal-dependent hydrolase